MKHIYIIYCNFLCPGIGFKTGKTSHDMWYEIYTGGRFTKSKGYPKDSAAGLILGYGIW